MSNHSYDDIAYHQAQQLNIPSAFPTAPQNETNGNLAFSSKSTNAPNPHVNSTSTEKLEEPSASENTPDVIITVRKHDVLSGRGVNIAQHPGNERFRSLVTSYTDKAYCTTFTVTEKKALAQQIVSHIQSLDPPGRFLKREGKGAVSRGLGGPWQELTEKDTIKKTCQALRDCNRHDRTGYAEGVNTPSDVKHVVDTASKAGLSVKDRAVAAVTTYKGEMLDKLSGYRSSSRGQGESHKTYSKSVCRRGIVQDQSTRGKRSRDEVDEAYYASIYPSLSMSSHGIGNQHNSGIGSQSASVDVTAIASATHSPIQATRPNTLLFMGNGTKSTKPGDYSRPGSVGNLEQIPGHHNGPALNTVSYANQNQYDHNKDPSNHDHHQHHHHNHHHHQYQHQHQTETGHHDYPYQHPSTYGYNQHFSALQYQNFHSHRGYSMNPSSTESSYHMHQESNPNPYHQMNLGYNYHYNQNSQSQFRPIDNQWPLKKQRTEDTDPSLTSTGVSSSAGASASSPTTPLDTSLDIVPAPAPISGEPDNVAEIANDFFKEADDSWTRGPLDGPDISGIEVAPNNSMDGTFVDSMGDELFSFDNVKY